MKTALSLKTAQAWDLKSIFRQARRSIGTAKVKEVLVYTAMMVKEDDISLYGFHNRESLELFRLLITVNGIGAKAAMAIMGSMSTDELRQAILFEDVKAVSKANGVGKKTAERLILELKDRIGSFERSDASQAAAVYANADESAGEDARTEAISALAALGYTKAEAFGADPRCRKRDFPAKTISKKP